MLPCSQYNPDGRPMAHRFCLSTALRVGTRGLTSCHPREVTHNVFFPTKRDLRPIPTGLPMDAKWSSPTAQTEEGIPKALSTFSTWITNVSQLLPDRRAC